MAVYRKADGTLTDVDAVVLFLRRAREYRAAGMKGWKVWSRMAREAYASQGGRLEILSEDEANSIAGSLGFHIDPATRAQAVRLRGVA